MKGLTLAAKEQRSSEFEPYVDNGGTIAAVAGKDFVIIAGDTRMSDGYFIRSRSASKLFKFSDCCVMASSGMYADFTALQKRLVARNAWYEHQNNTEISVGAFARMLSNMLYSKRFFPYYAFNAVAGLDAEGKGHVYVYDAVGSMEEVPVCAAGSGMDAVLPLLDNQIDFKTHTKPVPENLEMEDVLSILKDAFTSAGERDIQTGDDVEFFKITKDGCSYELFHLKRD